MGIRRRASVSLVLVFSILFLPAAATATVETPVHLSTTVTDEFYDDAGNNVGQLGSTYPNSTILQGQTWTFTNNSERTYKVRVRVLAPEKDCIGPAYVMAEYLQVKVKPGKTKSKTKTKKIGGYTDLLDWDGDGEWTDPVESYCIVVMTWPNNRLPDGQSIEAEADLIQLEQAETE